MYLVLVLIAAISFTIGGIYMKRAAGLTRLVPTLLVYLFFVIGASLQTLVMQDSHLGITYIFVLGLESILALLSGVLIFQEKYSVLKLFGVFLIVAGVIFLHTSNI